MKLPFVLMVLAAPFLGARSAGALELLNDSFAAGAQVNFQAGFADGEIGASRFVPTSSPVLLTSVQFLFGGASSTETITLHIWDDPGPGDAPGNELYMGDYDITGQNDARSEIDLTAQSLLITGPFRVGIEVHHTGPPGIAADTDMTIAADRNFIATAGGVWNRSAALGLKGDWIIRAEVMPFGSADAGPPDAATRDARVDSGTKCDGGGTCVDGGGSNGGGGGCGCQTAGRDASPAVAASCVAALIGGLLLRGRRRRRS